MLESELPYRKSDLPIGTSGKWVLEHFEYPAVPDVDPPVIDNRPDWAKVPAGRYTRLRCDTETFMTDTPDEWWTQKEAIDEIHRRGGHMLITGLGLGLILDSILGDPACPVEKVTVIEKSADVIALVGPHYLERYPGRLEIVNADAFTWQPPEGAHYSVVWHDIWPILYGVENPPQIKIMHDRYQDCCDWQGSWSQNLPPDRLDEGDRSATASEDARSTNLSSPTPNHGFTPDSTSTTTETASSKRQLVDQITNFLCTIGLRYRREEINETTVLPGIMIDHGALVYDIDKLKYPGDLLHEAGHLAVMLPERRLRAHRSVGKFAAEETTAIAWSYAAAIHLQIDPSVVFHPDGYRDGSEALLDNFAHGRFIGVPVLQWLGMTADVKTAQELGILPFPAMLKWLNEGPNGCQNKPSKQETQISTQPDEDLHRRP